MEQSELRKFHTRIEIRIIAGIVAVAIFISVIANGLVAVRIKADLESEAATKYLVDNTGYVNADTVERIQEKLQTLSDPVSLEDYYRLAGTQIAEEDYQGALGSIEQCIKLDDGSNQELHLDLLMKKGCLLVMLERDAEALISLDQVISEAPAESDAYLVKAQIYAKQEDLPNLVQALEWYLKYETGNAEIRELLAQAMFSMGDYAGAKAQYRYVLEEPGENTDLTQMQYLYGLTCIQLEDFQDAEEALLLALQQDETLSGIHYYIGVCKMSNEAYSEAVEFLSVSIEKGSMPQLSRYSRGISGLMTEGYDLVQAKEDLKFAAEYAGSDADESVRIQAVQLLERLAGIEAEAQLQTN